MPTHVHTVQKRHRQGPGQIASLADFDYTQGEEIGARVVIENSDLSVYCLDDERQVAVFAELPSDTDLTRVPFVYLTQGQLAQRLVIVPYSEFLELAAELPDIDDLIHVHGTGRSGSTLLHHAFNASGCITSLSEPDAANQLSTMRTGDGSRDRELGALMEAVTRFLFKPSSHPETAAHALKFRGEGVLAMDLYSAAFLGVKNILLYRYAVGWVASFYRLYSNPDRSDRDAIAGWADYFRQSFGKSPEEVSRYLGEGEDTPRVKAFALWWLFLVEESLRKLELGVTALPVRYDDLNRYRNEVIGAIFEYCGLPVSGVARGLEAFDRDSQEGTSLARTNNKKGNALKLSDAQVADVHEVLEQHPAIRTSDYMLPGTVTFS